MAGDVLEDGQDAAVVQGFGLGVGECGDGVGVAAEGTVADDVVAFGGEDVGQRGAISGDAHVAQLLRHHAGVEVNGAGGVGLVREFGGGRIGAPVRWTHAGDAATFLVDQD